MADKGLKGLVAKLESVAAQKGLPPMVELSVPSPDWDPAKHPHGKHGYWAKKGEATYHALLDLTTATPKKATYTSPGVSGHPSGVGLVKVGGAVILPPSGEPGNGGSVDYALHPGETAYTMQTNTGQSIAIVHADNSATELKPTGAEEPPAVGQKFAPGDLQTKATVGTVKLEQLDKNSGGPSTVQKVKAALPGTLVVSAIVAVNLPTGTVVRKRNTKYTHVWEDWTKQADGSWERTAAAKPATPLGAKKSSDAFGQLIEGGKSTFMVSEAPSATEVVTPKLKLKSGQKIEPLPEQPLPEAIKPGDKITSVKQLEAMPAEATVAYESAMGSKTTYIKGDDGVWHYHNIAADKYAGHIDQSSFQAAIEKGQITSVDPDPIPQWEKDLMPSPATGPLSKVGDTISSGTVLEHLPVGTVLHNVNKNGAWADYELVKDGWVRVDGDPKGIIGATQTHEKMGKLAGHADTELTIKSLPGQAPAAADTVQFSNHLEYHQGTSNKFYESSVVKHSDGSATHVTRWGSTTSQASPQSSAKGYVSIADATSAHVDKVLDKKGKGYVDGGFTESAAAAAMAIAAPKVPVPTSLEELAPEAFTPKISVMWAADPGTKVADKKHLDALPIGTVLTNSGVVGETGAGEVVKAPNGDWKSTNKKYGAYNVATNNAMKKGYLTIKSVPAQSVPTLQEALQTEAKQAGFSGGAVGQVPGTSVVLGDGESLYQSKGNVNKWAVVKGGKVVQLLDKDTGTDLLLSMTEGNYKSALWNWNKSLKDGKLILAGGEAQAAAAAPAKPKYAVTTKITSVDADQLPAGTKIKYFTDDGTPSDSHWTRQSNGSWKSSDAEQMSEDTGELNWSTGYWQITKLPEDYVSPPAAAPKAAAKSPKAKATKAELKSENTSFTLPDGKVLTPGPGEHVLIPPSDFEYANQVSAWLLQVSGKIQAYSATGQPYAPYQTYYAVKGKKSVKSLVAKGAALVASGPEKAEVELPVGQPTKEFGTVVELKNYATYSWFQSGEFVGSEMEQALSTHAPAGSDSIYASLEDPAFAQKVADMIASLSEGREKYKAQLTAGEKSKITKSVKALSGLLQLSVVAQRVAQPDHAVDAQDIAAVSEVKAIDPPNGLEKVRTAANWLTKRMDQVTFLQGVKDLGFDPLHATEEQAQQYATSKGAFNAAGMTADQAKQWMLLDLKAPGASGSKETIEGQAGIAIKTAAVAANAKAIAAKKQALAPSKSEVAASKAVSKKIAADYKTVASMHQMYSGPKGDLVYAYDATGWYLNGEAIDETAAAEMVKDPSQKWSPNGDKIGSPAQVLGKSLDATYGKEWVGAYADTLTGLGAMYALNMTAPDRKEWLRAYLRGDKIAQYNIEHKAAGQEIPAHPGSPDSPQGKLARQALSNYLAVQSWWHGYQNVNHWSAEDITSASDALGLMDAATVVNPALPSDSLSAKQMVGRWLDTHQDLPEPQNGKVQSEPVTITSSGGDKLEVPPGSLVVKSPPGAIAVLLDDKWYSASAPDGNFHESSYTGNFVDKQTAFGKFIESGYFDATPIWAPSEESTTGFKVAKPADLPQIAWDAATGAEAGGQALKDLIGQQYAAMDDDTLAHRISALSAYGSVSAEDRMKLAQAPDPVQRMAVWASAMAGENALAKNILQAIIVKARGGEYITSETQTWTPPGGKAIVIPPGSAIYKLDNGNYALITGKNSGFLFTATGGFNNNLGTGSVATVTTQGTKIIESFANLTPEKASLEGFEFTPEAWAALSAAEEAAGWTGDGPEAAAAFKFKQALESVPSTALSDQFAALQPKIHALPSGVKTLLVKAAQEKDTDQLTAVTWKIGKGFYDQQPTSPSKPLFKPDASYAQHIAAGHTDADAVETYWNWMTANAFAEEHGLAPTTPYWGDMAQAIADKISEIQGKSGPQAASKQVAPDPANALTLTYVKAGGGSHGAKIMTDQYADMWLVKNFGNDPFNDMRVEAEHYGNVIGRLFGFHTPQTFTRDVDGIHSYVQHWDDATGTLQGAGPEDLNDEQLGGVMETQVLNWAISNHDGYGANFLKHPDGKSIIAIDLGQTFKHHHDDKLAVGYLPPENYDPEWYDRFFKDVQSGKIPRERAEAVAKRVLFKAYNVQSQHDAGYEKHVSAMLDTRLKSAYPKQYPNKQALIAAALERKHNLVADFEKLYKGVWKQAGWDWQIDTEDFGKKIGDAHVSTGPQFVDDLAKTKAPGLALLVDSRSVADAHIMMTPLKVKGGKSVLGSAKICEEADKVLTAWLKERVEGSKPSGATPQVAVAPGAEMPYLEEMHQSIVNYSKTVYTHAPNGPGSSPDGKYNETTVQAAVTQAENLKKALGLVIKARDADPTKPYKGEGVLKFSTLEQQDSWVTGAQEKLKQYEQVKEAHGKNVPVMNLYPESKFPPGYLPWAYKPTKGLGEAGKIAEKWQVAPGEFAVKTADGGYYYEVDEHPKWTSKDDFLALIEGSGAEKLVLKGDNGKPSTETWTNADGTLKYVRKQDDPHHWEAYEEGQATGNLLSKNELNELMANDPNEWMYDNGSEFTEQSAESNLDGKKIKVTHANAGTHTGTVDFATGELVETKAAAGTSLQKGTDYLIEYDDVKIRYRPWSESGTYASQRGQMTFEIKDWDGSSAKVDDVMDTLRMMGLELSPADATTLELHYWRHVTEQSQIDSNNLSKIKAVKGEIAKRVTSGMTAAEELQAHREAWATAIGQQKVDDAPWEPKFNELFGQKGGKPIWMRPDFTIEDLHKAYGGGTSTPIQATDNVNSAINVIISGGLMGAEERVRVIGEKGSGAVCNTDQNNGSSNFVFTRQNTNPWGHGGSISGSYGFLLDPRDALRTSNYACAGDSYGSRGQSVGSYSGSKMFTLKGGSNELQIKDAVHVLYVVPGNDYARTDLIEKLKAKGIKKVRGIPVEEFVLGPNAWKQKMAEIWERVLTEAGDGEKAAA